eukprot:9970550-Karenia_brevis.AAC.1
MSYKGVGFVQYKDPRSLSRAWNYNHLRSRCGGDPENYGVAIGQEGFIWRMGNRVCALEPSLSEFAVKELNGGVYSQFGQRVHMDPMSNGGRAQMHNEEGGWKFPPNMSPGWGVATSS